MSEEWLDNQMRAYVEEIQGMIRARFPDATFAVYGGEDPPGIYIDVVADVDDEYDILDLVSDRQVDILLENGRGLYVVPLRRAAVEGRYIRGRDAHAYRAATPIVPERR